MRERTDDIQQVHYRLIVTGSLFFRTPLLEMLRISQSTLFVRTGDETELMRRDQNSRAET
jgi:hypothetical protein